MTRSGKLPYPFEDMGEQKRKEPIARPVRGLRVAPAEAIAGPPTANSAARHFKFAALAAPRLSIVVLPFVNLSDDREKKKNVRGITDDLTTDLSRIAGMSAISRSTAFTYRNKTAHREADRPRVGGYATSCKEASAGRATRSAVLGVASCAVRSALEVKLSRNPVF